MLIAIPSSLPGGLDANMGMHFGHCEIYTLVEVEDGAVKEVRTLDPIPHHHGGCMAPVEHLAAHGVKVLLAGGMGMRPLMACNQFGIAVHYAGNFPTVWAALTAYAEGRLQNFTSDFTCGGGHHHG